jgi:hypothetical protein
LVCAHYDTARQNFCESAVGAHPARSNPSAGGQKTTADKQKPPESWALVRLPLPARRGILGAIPVQRAEAADGGPLDRLSSDTMMRSRRQDIVKVTFVIDCNARKKSTFISLMRLADRTYPDRDTAFSPHRRASPGQEQEVSQP